MREQKAQHGSCDLTTSPQEEFRSFGNKMRELAALADPAERAAAAVVLQARARSMAVRRHAWRKRDGVV